MRHTFERFFHHHIESFSVQCFHHFSDHLSASYGLFFYSMYMNERIV
ncbi:hypothetical protein PT2222_140251 [Paraburkholderia tropica]